MASISPRAFTSRRVHRLPASRLVCAELSSTATRHCPARTPDLTVPLILCGHPLERSTPSFTIICGTNVEPGRFALRLRYRCPPSCNTSSLLPPAPSIQTLVLAYSSHKESQLAATLSGNLGRRRGLALKYLASLLELSNFQPPRCLPARSVANCTISGGLLHSPLTAPPSVPWSLRHALPSSTQRSAPLPCSRDFSCCTHDRSTAHTIHSVALRHSVLLP